MADLLWGAPADDGDPLSLHPRVLPHLKASCCSDALFELLLAPCCYAERSAVLSGTTGGMCLMNPRPFHTWILICAPFHMDSLGSPVYLAGVYVRCTHTVRIHFTIFMRTDIDFSSSPSLCQIATSNELKVFQSLTFVTGTSPPNETHIRDTPLQQMKRPRTSTKWKHCSPKAREEKDWVLMWNWFPSWRHADRRKYLLLFLRAHLLFASTLWSPVYGRTRVEGNRRPTVMVDFPAYFPYLSNKGFIIFFWATICRKRR